MFQLLDLLDNAKCYEKIREIRWQNGVRCPHCQCESVNKQGVVHTEHLRQRYQCKSCKKRFDDLTGTVFSFRHQGTSNYCIDFNHLSQLRYY